MVLDGVGAAGALGAGVEDDPPSVPLEDVVPAGSFVVDGAPASVPAADELFEPADVRLSVL